MMTRRESIFVGRPFQGRRTRAWKARATTFAIEKNRD